MALLRSCLLLLSAFLALPALACLKTGEFNSGITIGSQASLCLVVNDKYVWFTAPVVDQLHRIVVNQSYVNALALNDPWKPTACTEEGCLLTNVYVSAFGVNSIYRKRYPQDGDDTNPPSRFFPILTAIVYMVSGEVKSVFWDDACYFCSPTSINDCQFNAFSLSDGLPLDPNALGKELGRKAGYDCVVTASQCESSVQGTGQGAKRVTNPAGFCDLGVYVVWQGTDAKGHLLTSANQRFRRFRAYGMAAQPVAMTKFGGNSLPLPTD